MVWFCAGFWVWVSDFGFEVVNHPRFVEHPLFRRLVNLDDDRRKVAVPPVVALYCALKFFVGPFGGFHRAVEALDGSKVSGSGGERVYECEFCFHFHWLGFGLVGGWFFSPICPYITLSRRLLQGFFSSKGDFF